MSSSELIEFDLNFQSALIGVDEVGRGALAGPVFTSAVHFQQLETLEQDWVNEINDSKKLNAKQRDKLSACLKEACIHATASSSVEEIDNFGILAATFLAMRRAIIEVVKVANLEKVNCLVLVDGNLPLTGLKHRQRNIIKGDSKSFHIAAASIIAKTQRDNFMKELSKSYSEDFNWTTNVGYGTEKHRQAIIKHGLTKEHRNKFVKTVLDKYQQLSLI